MTAADSSPEDYIDWALDAGMFFVQRGEHLCDMTGTRFREFVEGKGRCGIKPMFADWETHLTTLFPETRLKSYVEIRCADSNSPGHAMAYSALCAGLFYGSEDVLAGADELSEGWTAEQRREFHDACARDGLSAKAPDGRTAQEMAKELLALAAQGLAHGREGERERLAPAEAIVESGRSPAASVLERWEGPWAGNLDRLADDLNVRP